MSNYAFAYYGEPKFETQISHEIRHIDKVSIGRFSGEIPARHSIPSTDRLEKWPANAQWSPTP